MRNFSTQWVLALAIVFWRFKSPSGLQLPNGSSLWSVKVHSLTLSHNPESMKCDSRFHSWPAPSQDLARVTTTHLGAWINNKPFHTNLHMVAFQEGTNLFQPLQIIYMHDNDGPSIRQKLVCKKHNGFNKIIHSLVPNRNEGKGLRDMRNREIKWYIYNNKVNLVVKRNLNFYFIF
jgi:hypothetical protein